MPLGMSGYAGRSGSELPSVDAGAVNGQREEDVGIAEHIVVEVIFRCGAEIVDVEAPAGNGDG